MTDIREKIEDWRSNLLDLTKRNSLISCKISSRAGLRLAYPDAETVWQTIGVGDGKMTFAWKAELVPEIEEEEEDIERTEESVPNEENQGNFFEITQNQDPKRRIISLQDCLESPRLDEDALVSEMTDREMDLRLRRMKLHQKESLTEKGVHSLFLSFGLLKWYESNDSEQALLAPLMLVPVNLDRKNVDSPWNLSEYEDEAIPNFSITQRLIDDFGLELPQLPKLSELEKNGARHNYLSEVAKSIQEFDRWEVVDCVVLNNFSFQKIAMWQDLDANWERISDHPLCCSIAGDNSTEVSTDFDIPALEDFDDKIPPHDLHSILDCDSSQLEAIVAVKEGMSLVLDGPPGTGKSQTIANLIAEFLADGKTVLFVSEKSAALEVVKKRLDQRSLGDFCLECHSHKANKKEVVQELARSLELHREEYSDQVKDMDELQSVRNRLNKYVRALHKHRDPLGMTAYQAHGHLSKVQNSPRTSCGIERVDEITAIKLTTILELLERLKDCQNVIQNYQNFSWRDCRVTEFSLSLEDEMTLHFRNLATILNNMSTEFQELIDLGLLEAIPALRNLNESMSILRELLKTPVIPREFFNENTRIIAETILEVESCVSQQNDLIAKMTVLGYEKLDEDFISSKVESLSEIFTEGCTNETQSSSTKSVSLQVEDRLFNEKGWRSFFTEPPFATVKTQITQLHRMLSELEALEQCLSDLKESVDRVMKCLTVFLTNEPPIKVMMVLLNIGKVITTSGSLRHSWFEESRRNEIKLIASKCAKELREIEPLQSELVSRLSSRAFGDEGKELVTRSGKYNFFWKRWSGDYREFKEDLQAIYLDDIPQTVKGIYSDLQKLQRCHKTQERLKRYEQEVTSDLVTDSENNTDWNLVLVGLDAVADICRLIKVPKELIDTLCSAQIVDRSNLEDAVNELENCFLNLENEINQTNNTVKLDQIGKKRKNYDELALQSLFEFLNEATLLANNRLKLLADFEKFLCDGKDVAIKSLPDDARSIFSLCRLQRKQRRALDRLEQLDFHVDLESAVQHCESATWLLEQLDQHNEAIPADIEKVATTPACKEIVEKVSLNIKRLAGNSFKDAFTFLKKSFDISERNVDGFVIRDRPINLLADWLEVRSQDLANFREWIRFSEIKSQLEDDGISNLIEDVLENKVALESVDSAFIYTFYRKWLDKIYGSVKRLRNFNVDDHERLIERFRNLDKKIIRNGFCRIRSKLLDDPDRPHASMLQAPNSSELGTLQKECNKKSRHKPLRVLFKQIPKMLQRLKPCMMMSPLAVSTYLDSASLRFDLVIFDEASQVRPYDAIGAIYRGDQLVVAGDQKQMPPTTFFDRMGSEGEYNEEDEEDSGLGDMRDFDSILDVCLSMGMPRKRLRWHYRSKFEQLIAFSNHHFYEDDLVTFPSIHDGVGTKAVEHVYVEDGRWKSGTSGGFNEIEARKTVELIFEHFENHADKSLGVVTFNQKQQLMVGDFLFEGLKNRPEMEDFCGEEAEEALFIKNLENVQGDERDVIILSMAYGKDENGRLYKRFGPLNRQGGERRLNVAITRARERVIFVSSVRAGELDIAPTAQKGAHLLKSYLDYAERGISSLGLERTEDPEAQFDSPFEAEVYSELTKRGYQVRKQIGCGGYRIDLAILHPDEPGRFVLGVECDGAAYHSSKTARDRDRLRQSVLEDNLGWTILRIWSTDWIRDRDRQLQRVHEAIEISINSEHIVEVGDSKPSSADSDELQPSIIERDSDEEFGNGWIYDEIDSVPSGDIVKILINLLRRMGATDQDELIKQISKELGFARVGNRIKGHLAEELTRCESNGQIETLSDGKVSISN